MVVYDFKHPRFGKLVVEGVYHKGKNGLKNKQHKTSNLRFKCRPLVPTYSVNDNIILYLDDSTSGLESIGHAVYNKVVDSTHIKNGSYNYYLLGDDDVFIRSSINSMLHAWLSFNPLVPTNGYYHAHVSDIQNYKGVVFDENGIKVA